MHDDDITYSDSESNNADTQPSQKKTKIMKKQKRNRAAIEHVFSDEEVYLLISLVEINKTLWDPTHEEYKNKMKNSSIWDVSIYFYMLFILSV